ncbi:MAG: phosphate ABC transporter substrate-binding protein PstS [Sorangiineae bacterium NIC37A_2]|nr:MAG: phosphate ABC transporter substrate-binding protein PstS [Sorangiineae bacterium NIC37A_2]
MVERRSVLKGLSALLLLGLAAGCKRGDPNSPNIYLGGAGATFPFPLYSKWMSEYNKLHPEIRINYQSIGSGGGIRQIASETVDFGATDTPMSASDAKKAPRAILHIPVTIGAVVVAYNIPGVTGELKLDGDVLADIFLGTIKTWNDERIARANPGLALPSLPIAVVTRSDGSGTTAVFTGYLASVSPKFQSVVGEGKSVKWPVGLGAKGNEGVTGQLKTTPGTIGYTELAYASQNRLTTAAIKNREGAYASPKVSAVTAAAEQVELDDSLVASLVNAPGAASYPIASFTYLLVYEESKNARKGEALAKFIAWAVHDGQGLAAALHYAPLPARVVQKIDERIKSLHFGGKPFLSQGT